MNDTEYPKVIHIFRAELFSVIRTTVKPDQHGTLFFKFMIEVMKNLYFYHI